MRTKRPPQSSMPWDRIQAETRSRLPRQREALHGLRDAGEGPRHRVGAAQDHAGRAAAPAPRVHADLVPLAATDAAPARWHDRLGHQQQPERGTTGQGGHRPQLGSTRHGVLVSKAFRPIVGPICEISDPAAEKFVAGPGTLTDQAGQALGELHRRPAPGPASRPRPPSPRPFLPGRPDHVRAQPSPQGLRYDHRTVRLLVLLDDGG